MIDKNIPASLKQLKQWVVWQFEDRGGKLTKVPYNANTGEMAKSNDPSTWASYEQALKVLPQFSGLGIMFSNNIFGVDIDAEDDTKVKAYLNNDPNSSIGEFIHTLKSYAEYSPSGKGIHILAYGKLPEGRRRRGDFEMYDHGRFFTVTGNIAAPYKDLIDCTETIKPLHAKYIQQDAEKPIQAQAVSNKPVSIDLNDTELFEIIEKSKQGSLFMQLYNGSWGGTFNSQSDADLSFCNMLAFWTGKDYARMDAIFRRSGLMRPKWDELRGATTYGAMTINAAIAGTHAVFEPKPAFNIEIKNQEPKKEKAAATKDIVEISQEIIKQATNVENKYYTYDDTGNAERFIAKYKEIVKYSYIDNIFYIYDGKQWKTDKLGHIKILAENVITEMEGERENENLLLDADLLKVFNRHLTYSRSSRGKENMLKEIKHRISLLPDDFDKHKYLLNINNGMLDLKTGNLYKHHQNYYTTKLAPINYNPAAKAPLWEKFLNDTFGSDQELIRYIQKAVGYSLTGSTKEQCIFICIGDGNNGKSVFFDVIRKFLGDYITNAQADTIMTRKNGNTGANSDIARLKGARVVTTSESEQGALMNEGLVKQLTGDDTVTARFQYGQEFEYKPEFKIWLATNHKPIIRGKDKGIWRRMHTIPFKHEVPAHLIDKDLTSKLINEIEGIFSWAVQGCTMWAQEGLEQPQAVKDMVKEYRQEMDVVINFLKDCTTNDPTGTVKASDLYKAYKDWATDNGEYLLSNTKFGQDMIRYYEKKRTNQGMVYIGLILNHNAKPINFNFNNVRNL